MLGLRSLLMGSSYRFREFLLDFLPLAAAFAALATLRAPSWAGPLVAAQLFLGLRLWGSSGLAADFPEEARALFAQAREKLVGEFGGEWRA